MSSQVEEKVKLVELIIAFGFVWPDNMLVRLGIYSSVGYLITFFFFNKRLLPSYFWLFTVCPFSCK